jgi:hypothetical protein
VRFLVLCASGDANRPVLEVALVPPQPEQAAPAQPVSPLRLSGSLGLEEKRKVEVSVPDLEATPEIRRGSGKCGEERGEERGDRSRTTVRAKKKPS